MITQTQFPFEALIITGLSSQNIILLILAGIAILIAGAYFIIKAFDKKDYPIQ